MMGAIYRSVKWARDHLELLFWMLALLMLYFMPLQGDHYSLCVPSMMGLENCPGCGLGHAIHLFLHGKFGEAWQNHPIVMVALPIIVVRIFALIKNEITHKKLTHAK